MPTAATKAKRTGKRSNGRHRPAKPRSVAMVREEIGSIAELRPDPKNCRRHNPRNIGSITNSLQAVGAARSIVIDENNTILAGNGMVEAAGEAGITKLKIVEADGNTVIAVRRRGLTDKQKAQLAIADNRTAELAEWDAEQLLKTIAEHEIDLSAIEFNEDEIRALQVEALGEREVVEDETPAASDVPLRCKAGDLWKLGAHRLLCGDSTKAEDVGRLMGGEKAALCFTSPPYAQQRDYTKESQGFDWDALMQGVFGNLPMTDDGQVLVNLGLVHRDGEWLPYWEGWIEWMRAQGWRRFGWYVWDQGSGLPGDWNGRFAPSHEFVFHFNRSAIRPVKSVATKEETQARKGKSVPIGFRKEGGSVACTSPDKIGQPFKIPDSVLRINRHTQDGQLHPATFPVAFASALIQSWHGIAYEPFCGSGTTIIAAEQLGRRCYGLEISPTYCDVILARWEKFTGKQAEKL